MSVEIKNTFTGAVILVVDAANLCSADLRGADLCGASLCSADLCDANLRDANLRDADLCGASLCSANLRGAHLCRADLRDADLCGADLCGANLRGADLRDANLRDANLRGADLRDANLRDANLCDANLCRANLRGAKNADLAIAITRILPEGDLIGWKKCRNDVIVKLRIPAEAKRSHAFGRKCRAEFADVIEVIGADVGTSSQKPETTYRVGERVMPDSFDEDWTNECSHGIHFFITKAEAEAY